MISHGQAPRLTSRLAGLRFRLLGSNAFSDGCPRLGRSYVVTLVCSLGHIVERYHQVSSCTSRGVSRSRSIMRSRC